MSTSIQLPGLLVSPTETKVTDDMSVFNAGWVRGYRTAVSNVVYRENPSMTPKGSERFLDGFDIGYETAKDDIRHNRPMQYGRLGLDT